MPAGSAIFSESLSTSGISADDFAETVVADFLAEYTAGRTPNPCLRCNEKIKFTALLDRAIALGFDAVATGHYARIADGALLRSVDAAKDQSYVLAVLTPEQVRHSMFPLGGMTKDAVRAEAARRGFAVAAKPDSYDICFIPEGDTHGYLVEKLGARTGSVIDAGSGEVLGTHDGYFSYTIGQRKGLGLSRPAADGRPRYVLGIEPLSGTVTVGGAEDLDVGWIQADRVVFASGPVPTRVDAVPDRAEWTIRGRLQVRAHAATTAVTAEYRGGVLRLDLDDPIRAVAPGQSAVLYDGSDAVVLAAGTIVATRPAERSHAGGVGARPGVDA